MAEKPPEDEEDGAVEAEAVDDGTDEGRGPFTRPPPFDLITEKEEIIAPPRRRGVALAIGLLLVLVIAIGGALVWVALEGEEARTRLDTGIERLSRKHRATEQQNNDAQQGARHDFAGM